MRTAEEAAKRCLCLEVLCQRVALEQQVDELGKEDAESLRAGMIAGIANVDCDGAFVGTEPDVLCAEIGDVDLEDERIGAWFADVTVMLWCLKRIPELLTVDELESGAINAALEKGFWATGDADKIKKALSTAKLRPRVDLERTITTLAKANAIAVSTNPDVEHTELPPMTMLYVVPWILLPKWPWGKACDLEKDLGLKMTITDA